MLLFNLNVLMRVGVDVVNAAEVGRGVKLVRVDVETLLERRLFGLLHGSFVLAIVLAAHVDIAGTVALRVFRGED